MRVWHDNTGNGTKQSWYLQYIAVRDLQTRERFYFICNEWFSLVEGDGLVRYSNVYLIFIRLLAFDEANT